jgi:hypothetical protein
MCKATEDGKCPFCLRKMLVYKGRNATRGYFCNRCDRSFNLDTGEFQPNWCWLEPMLLHKSAAVVAFRDEKYRPSVDNQAHFHHFISKNDSYAYKCKVCPVMVLARDVQGVSRG